MLAPNIYYIDLTIKRNNPPFLIDQSKSLVIPSIKVTQSFAYTLLYSEFDDAEDDSFLIACTTSSGGSDTSWVNYEHNMTVSGNVTFFGKVPPS